MMSEIYLFQFSKNTFCGKIKLTKSPVKIKISYQFHLNLRFYEVGSFVRVIIFW